MNKALSLFDRLEAVAAHRSDTGDAMVDHDDLLAVIEALRPFVGTDVRRALTMVSDLKDRASCEVYGKVPWREEYWEVGPFKLGHFRALNSLGKPSQ